MESKVLLDTVIERVNLNIHIQIQARSLAFAIIDTNCALRGYHPLTSKRQGMLLMWPSFLSPSLSLLIPSFP